MMKLNHKLTGLFMIVLGLGFGLGQSVQAQNRGGFGGGAGGSTTTRTYPSNGQIGDAYFSIDPESRRVVVITDEATALSVGQVLTNLDRPKPQVLIKVAFVQVARNTGLDLGVEGAYAHNIGGGQTNNLAQVFGLSGLNSSSNALNALGMPTQSFQPISPMTAQGAGLYQILGQDYQVALRAIAQSGNAKILSRASIMARNNQPAIVQVGQEVPLVTSTSYNGLNGTPINAYSYQPVGVILQVTPFITADGLVEMILSPQVSSIDQTTSIPIAAGVSAPVIDISQANTVVVTPSGQTVVIGGLIQDQKTKMVSKVPLLGDIPGLGALFRHTITTDSKSELIIFLTPKVVEAPQQYASVSDRERARSQATQGLTDQELDRFLDSLPQKTPAKGSKTK
jgi:type II secretory pathway component GspD/PulD (secretin)